MSRPLSTATRSLAKEARESSGFCALYIVAATKPLPPRYPSNRPFLPVTFGVTTSPRDIRSKAVRWSWEEVELHLVWTLSARHADLIRKKLEALLRDDEVLIRGTWYDVELKELMDLVAFAAALTGVEIFGEEEREARLQVMIAETLRGRRRKLEAYG